MHSTHSQRLVKRGSKPASVGHSESTEGSEREGRRLFVKRNRASISQTLQLHRKARKEKPADSRSSQTTVPEQFGTFRSLVRVWILRSCPALAGLAVRYLGSGNL